MEISRIMKSLKPDQFYFKVESNVYELLERMREEVMMTYTFKEAIK